MSRILVVLVSSAIIGSAVPAFAGPNGTSVAPYYPLYPQLNVPRDERPYGLLGDADESHEARASDREARWRQPAPGWWQRRPSEGK